MSRLWIAFSLKSKTSKDYYFDCGFHRDFDEWMATKTRWQSRLMTHLLNTPAHVFFCPPAVPLMRSVGQPGFLHIAVVASEAKPPNDMPAST